MSRVLTSEPVDQDLVDEGHIVPADAKNVFHFEVDGHETSMVISAEKEFPKDDYYALTSLMEGFWPGECDVDMDKDCYEAVENLLRTQIKDAIDRFSDGRFDIDKFTFKKRNRDTAINISYDNKFVAKSYARYGINDEISEKYGKVISKLAELEPNYRAALLPSGTRTTDGVNNGYMDWSDFAEETTAARQILEEDFAANIDGISEQTKDMGICQQ